MPTISLPTPGLTPGIGWATQLNVAINAINNEVDIQANELAINVTRFPSVQSAIDSAPAGATLFFPSTMSPVAVPAGGFALKSNNLTIDARGVEFQVSNWGTPAFLALRSNGGGDGHTFRIGMVRYTGVRGNHTGALIRGSVPYCSGCGVWTNGDRNFIEYLRTDGMPTPIFFASWNGSTMNDRVGVGNRIGYLEATRYNFALLFVRQRAFDFGNAYCHDDLDDSGGANPTHAIYGSASDGFRSEGGFIGDWLVENNMGGAPFQFKFTDGIVAGTLTGNSSAGIASIQNCNDLSATAFVGEDVRAPVTGTRIVEFVGTSGACKRIDVGRIVVDKAAGVNIGSVLLIFDESGRVGSISVESRNSVDAGQEVNVRGEGTFSILSVLVNARATGMRPLRLGDATEAGRAVGWSIPNVRSTGSATYDPIPVEEFPQCHSNMWGDGNNFLSGTSPVKGTYRRGMRWSAFAPAVGAPRGWVQTVNGTLSGSTWASTTAVAAGAFVKLADGRVLRYQTGGTTGGSEPNPSTVGATGPDGSAAWTLMSLTSGTVVSEGNL